MNEKIVKMLNFCGDSVSLRKVKNALYYFAKITRKRGDDELADEYDRLAGLVPDQANGLTEEVILLCQQQDRMEKALDADWERERLAEAEWAEVEVVTYPEMDKEIVSLLKLRGGSVSLYAAARIEELETETERLRDQAQRAEAEVQEVSWSNYQSRRRRLEEAGKPTPTLLEQMTELDVQVTNLRGALQAALLPLETAADALVPPGARVKEAAGLVEDALVAMREGLENSEIA